MTTQLDYRFKGHELVVKDLGFMQSAYTLEVTELRLVAMAIIVLRRDSDRAKFDPTVPVTLHANMYAELFNTTRQNAYQVLDYASKSLHNRRINWVDVYQDNVDAKGRKRKSNRINDLRWTSQCSYVPELGIVQLFFSPQIIPFLIHLDKNFAGYEIRNLIKLTTPYEFRMYELGVAWKKKGVATFTKQALREKLGILDENQLKTSSNFNRMLNRSLETINTETDLNMSFTPNYERNAGSKGRYVSSYTMSVKVRKGQFVGMNIPGECDDDNGKNQLPPAIPGDNKEVDEDEFLNNLGSNGSFRVGANDSEVEDVDVVNVEKPSIQPKSKQYEEPVQRGFECFDVVQPDVKQKFKHHGIVKTDHYIRAYPNEDGSWDIEGILKYIEKPIFQIIGMDIEDIPLELVEGTNIYKHAEGRSAVLAAQQSKMMIGRKIALSRVKNESGGVQDETMQRKAKHGRIHLTAKEIEIVMNDGAFRSRYAPVSVSDPSVIREHLKKLLTGDLSKIPDLDDYLRFFTN